MDNFTDRYLELLHQIKSNSTKLAKELGYDNNGTAKFYRLEKGNKPSFDLLAEILKMHPEINERWLILGEGKIWKDSKNIETNDIDCSKIITENNLLIKENKSIKKELERTWRLIDIISNTLNKSK